MSCPLGAHHTEPDEAYARAHHIGVNFGTWKCSWTQALSHLELVRDAYAALVLKRSGFPIGSMSGFQMRLHWVMRDAARSARRDYNRSFHEARKLIGPHLSRGGDRATAIADVERTFPVLEPDHVEQIVDEEAAWWLRWRYDQEIAA